MKQKKIMEVNDSGLHLVCMKTDDPHNPYRLYDVWHDMGKHQKLIVKYADFESVICWLYQTVMF